MIPRLTIVCLVAIEAAAAGSMTLANLERWPQADSLFTRDRYWLGGDEASTVDLGDGRILWLFGDSFIGTDSTRDRAHSVMVRNSIAIGYGRDPTNARIWFYWEQTRGRPRSFFPEPRSNWPSPGPWSPLGTATFIGSSIHAVDLPRLSSGLGAGWRDSDGTTTSELVACP